MPSATAHAPPALRLPLRPYQAEALQALLDARARGVTRPWWCCPWAPARRWSLRTCCASGRAAPGPGASR